MKTQELHSQRLILREVRAQDAQYAFKYWFSNKDVGRYMFWTVQTDFSETLEWIDYELSMIEDDLWYRFIVVDSEERNLFGTVLLYMDEELQAWEIAYHFSTSCWNQGYATEAVQTVLGFARKVLMLDRVYARYAKANIASGRVLAKSGFRVIKEIEYWYNENTKHTKGWLCVVDLSGGAYDRKRKYVE